jgi:hypothetical protein
MVEFFPLAPAPTAADLVYGASARSEQLYRLVLGSLREVEKTYCHFECCKPLRERFGGCRWMRPTALDTVRSIGTWSFIRLDRNVHPSAMPMIRARSIGQKCHRSGQIRRVKPTLVTHRARCGNLPALQVVGPDRPSPRFSDLLAGQRETIVGARGGNRLHTRWESLFRSTAH